MSDMIERVARAIYPSIPATDFDRDRWQGWDEVGVDNPWRNAALRAARSAIDAVHSWQPIETAPKDGSIFVVARFVESKPEYSDYEICQYDPYECEGYEEVGDNLYRKATKVVSEWRSDNFHRATHWQPLPPPPNTKGEG